MEKGRIYRLMKQGLIKGLFRQGIISICNLQKHMVNLGGSFGGNILLPAYGIGNESFHIAFRRKIRQEESVELLQPAQVQW